MAASRAAAGDADDWYRKWSDAAGRAEALAKAAEGHRESTIGAWLRAMEYWRQAIFYIRGDLDDARLQTGWRGHRAAFRAALKLMPYASTIAEIPLGAGKMTGYLMRQPGPAAPRPTIILFPGYQLDREVRLFRDGVDGARPAA